MLPQIIVPCLDQVRHQLFKLFEIPALLGDLRWRCFRLLSKVLHNLKAIGLVCGHSMVYIPDHRDIIWSDL